MALYSNYLVMLFGGGPTATIVNTAQTISVNNQALTETVPVGSTRRSIFGPNVNGHFALQVFVDSAGGATSAMTVWYSNLPSPSLANDNDWTQDTTIGTIDLATTTSKFITVGNVDAQWIMLKATAVTSSANIRAVIRVEGYTHGMGVDA
jgi:hypothetical protein